MANREKFAEHVNKMIDDLKDLQQDKLLFRYNGVLYPSLMCNQETFEALNSFETREDDIMLAAYPKCGTNWTLHLLEDMVHAVHKKDPTGFIPVLEFTGENKFEKFKEEASPRILVTHLSYDGIPKNLFNKKYKILVVFRNPKDTALSYYHFYKNNPVFPTYSSWDTFFEDFMTGNVCWGSYFDHVLEWNKHIDDENIMIVTFEEMKEDLEAAIKKMSLFSGFSLSEEQIQSIADKGTFKSMKEKSEKTHGAFGKVLFRKGEVGDWKNIFTEAQNQEMDAKFEQCLAGTKLGEMLQYNVYCK
ncbi:sulfotransferase 6B1 isoform X1 [Xenopus laevis]|uniref:Sulfotransferase n=1 Tax=Xenopus laevis TaxID=8355 RepID=A0A8J1KMX1_XENLA|nr:sulfotransferase 6B1 isoform X1 [Xenopus laevis]